MKSGNKSKLKKRPGPTTEAKAHPWRPCPLGKHWVRAHPRNRVSSKGKPFTQQMPGTCREGRSHLDHLYRDEIHEVAAQNFSKLTGPPASDDFEFKAKGNRYDELIRGWTMYWNDVLRPKVPLDPDIVKALIATESGFNPKARNGLRGKMGARGLMQVLNQSVQLLKDPKEMGDHFVNLDNDDMTDPNLSICAGIRWLFRKKQLLEANSKKSLSWRDAIIKYKKAEKKHIDRFDEYYRKLKRIK
ncbi:MAG: transglycosylase SLT domain-containing protein [Deltaproteobacteria bacterium]|nr:transglycosylase SLT domain-containing protein [Deltaproteobacteria bacterium]